jgi:hypothetical protein
LHHVRIEDVIRISELVVSPVLAIVVIAYAEPVSVIDAGAIFSPDLVSHRESPLVQVSDRRRLREGRPPLVTGIEKVVG